MPEKKLTRRSTLDPVVADLLSGMQQRQVENQLPRKERERLSRERAKIQSRREQRATYDLPPSLREDIRELAEELHLPASQLVTLALARFMKDYHESLIDLSKFKQPSRSPRYEWNLIFPEDFLRSKKKKG